MSPEYIPQATVFVSHTPSGTAVPYEYCTFYLTQDANVSLVDKEGNISSTIPMKAGYQPILVSKITAVSAGSVYIMSHSKLK